MKLEQQVVSLELAQKLKELGVKQESYFQHYLRYKGQDIEHWVIGIPFDYEDRSDDVVSAFTCSELGEMLPTYFHKDGSECRITIVNGNGLKYIDYATYKNQKPAFLLNGYPMLMNSTDTEADARAKMLVYLLENNLITL